MLKRLFKFGLIATLVLALSSCSSSEKIGINHKLDSFDRSDVEVLKIVEENVPSKYNPEYEDKWETKMIYLTPLGHDPKNEFCIYSVNNKNGNAKCLMASGSIHDDVKLSVYKHYLEELLQCMLDTIDVPKPKNLIDELWTRFTESGYQRASYETNELKVRISQDDYNGVYAILIGIEPINMQH